MLAAHNRLVAGSSPAGPTTHSHRLRVYLVSCIYVIKFKGLAVFIRSHLVSIFDRFWVFDPPVSGLKNSFPGKINGDGERPVRSQTETGSMI
jgi:hypothetical protein